MPKRHTRFVCQECGHQTSKWMGRCPSCEAWNTLVEEVEVGPAKRKGVQQVAGLDRVPQSIVSVGVSDAIRCPVGFSEVDRVLGGGFVTGSLTLVGGEPGVGKSTLLLQMSQLLAAADNPVLYVTGEESVQQIRLRAERLGALNDRLSVVSETDVAAIVSHIEREQPRFVVIDSIQTTVHPDVESGPGSISQVRESTATFMRVAKSADVGVILVGHVNKQGALAGPKVLEHAVDVVLYLEGERHTAFRILRAAKNRYGSTQEIGIFEMSDTGMRQVSNPSELFLQERPVGEPGSAVIGVLEGTRPLLVEVQALVSPAPFGGTPRRQASGVDYNRMSIMLAVLEKRAGLRLQSEDVYVNVAGGVRVDEPAGDLGIAIAVASGFTARPVEPATVVFGEVGLAGEVRGVKDAAKRMIEAAKLGFKRCVMPASNAGRMPHAEEMDVVGVRHLRDALEVALSGRGGALS